MDRKKVFVTTELEMKDDDTQQTILDRFGKCQERLRTDYVDALYMHSVPNAHLNNEGFHAAVKQLKADGRVRFTGSRNTVPEARKKRAWTMAGGRGRALRPDAHRLQLHEPREGRQDPGRV